MDIRADIREFLASRRARITPQQAGLPVYGGHRRVPGLRREEVALLAGVSVDYYVRLERGNLSGVSAAVLESLVRALHLDEAERAHLFDLARAVNATGSARPRPTHRIRPNLQRLLDAMTDTPASVRNRRLDILATNRLGRALYSPLFHSPARPVNMARFQFLDPAGADYFPDWDASADTTVALLRTEGGRHPDDKGLTDLVGELSMRSDDFRTRWAQHNVRLHHTGTKRFHHPVVGDLTLDFEAMVLGTDPGLTLTAYIAAPDSASSDALALLASWAATNDEHPLLLP